TGAVVVLIDQVSSLGAHWSTTARRAGPAISEEPEDPPTDWAETGRTVVLFSEGFADFEPEPLAYMTLGADGPDWSGAEGPVYSGNHAARLDGGGGDWEHRMTPEEPIETDGLGALVFAFHMGDATGTQLAVAINVTPVDLVSEGLVDMASEEWQFVAIPLGEFGVGTVTEQITSVSLAGDLIGPFYYDEMRLLGDLVIFDESMRLPAGVYTYGGGVPRR
ncbi:hypothetical protein ACFL6X_08590, partial [Candidatus Latescibacterota bacterium]